MTKLSFFRKCLILFASAAWGLSPPVFAKDSAATAMEGMQEHHHSFDWIQHTQQTLDELKVKLNLSAEQIPAWDAWSRGVLKDAQQQIDRQKVESEKAYNAEKSMADATTPDQMAAGIVRLRAETTWMQEHLAHLEAAQVRTKAFYTALSVNQRTIFDLFWHEMHHKVAGHDGDLGMHERDESGCGQMMHQQ
jgi:hypothetical protein